MVFSRLASFKHLAFALGILSLGVCGVEFSLHLYDACVVGARDDDEKSACTASWTVHHRLHSDARISAVDPDSGAQLQWQTNSLGLRGPEVDVPKPAGTYRIVCLGDESTLAAQTPEQETFCILLQERLRAASQANIEIINAGCPQYGPLLSLLLFKNSLLALSPDLVIYNFDMSDVADDHGCWRYLRTNGSRSLCCPHPDLLRGRTAKSKPWFERLVTWQYAKRGLGSLLESQTQPDDARDIDSPLGKYAWLRDDAPDWSVYIAQTLGVIGELSDVCRRSHCEFVLAVIPAPWQVAAEASSGPGVRARSGVEQHAVYHSRAPSDTLSAFAKKERIRYCDARATFVGTPRPERLYLRNAAHYSAAGHELYARVLEDYLRQHVVAPWRSGRQSEPRPERRLTDGAARRSFRTARQAGFDGEEESTTPDRIENGRIENRGVESSGRAPRTKSYSRGARRAEFEDPPAE